MRKIKEILSPPDVVFLGWLLLASILILFRRNDVPYSRLFLGIFIGLFLVTAFILYLVRNIHSNRFGFLILRYSYAPFFFLLKFESVHFLNRLYFSELLDPIFIRAEEAIFGLQPSIEFWKAVPYDFFSEIMHMTYFAFYPMFAFLILYPLFKRRMDDFLSIIFVLVFAFDIFYLIYYILPVAGPRIVIPEAAAIPHNGYIFSNIMVFIYKFGGITGAAFPSSHCGMATVNTLLVWRYIKPARWPITIISTLLVISTFYLRYHYVIDSIAGITTGIVLYLTGVKLLSYLKKQNFRWPFEKG